MNAHDFLALLDGVRNRGNGQWLARCPAHDDKSPSLSIKEYDTGAIGIHCFASCPSASVVTALGLTMSDLFPERLVPTKGRRPRWNPRDVQLAIKHEVLVVACAAGQQAEGKDVDLERVQLAATRILDALEVANVR